MVNKQFTIIISLFFVSAINAQIINAGFESWADGKPDGWTIRNNNMSIFQTTDCYSGMYAVKLRSGFKLNSIGSAQIISGKSENGIPVSQRYSNLSGWYKYIHSFWEELKIYVYLKKNGNYIGYGLIDTLRETSSYKKFTCQFTYYSNEMLDTVMIILSFTDNNPTGIPSDASAYFDDLTLEFPVDINETKNEQLLTDFNLDQNFPNPFNPSTMIRYSIPSSEFVKLNVYDILGRTVSELISEETEAGIHEVEFDASHLSSGIYFYSLQAGEFMQTKKLILMK